MTLREMAREAVENSLNRGLSTDAVDCLKHCAGEVVEATEAYCQWAYEFDSVQEPAFISELADIIMCVLVICGAEDIDIEHALLECLEKNRKRAKK